MNNSIIKKFGQQVFNLIDKYCEINEPNNYVVSTTNQFNIENKSNNLKSIVNLSRTNNIRYINRFLICVNQKLEHDGVFIGCVETINARKERKWINKIPLLRTIYFTCEFIFLRVFPKLWGVKRIYFFVTRGRNRLLSKAEMLGRLVSCGFEILHYETINGLLYFVVKKIKEPIQDNVKPSYGPIYKMPRMGKNGKIIGVYKFRTMHPYAEFLHDYILKTYGYSNSGKPANDFRLTPWGKFFRRYWIDEMPQLINLIKGEVKLVGVRPISPRFFQDIPKDLQELRLGHKPGCIPPYVALNKTGSVEDVLAAEKKYLEDLKKHPLTTDMKYFFNAIINIVFKKKRSA
jgi:lipopolysaccharide/colanic/teichoic acid biosynthesis glycosyltransferase